LLFHRSIMMAKDKKPDEHQRKRKIIGNMVA
jgi:hypothetical protein